MNVESLRAGVARLIRGIQMDNETEAFMNRLLITLAIAAIFMGLNSFQERLFQLEQSNLQARDYPTRTEVGKY